MISLNKSIKTPSNDVDVPTTPKDIVVKFSVFAECDLGRADRTAWHIHAMVNGKIVQEFFYINYEGRDHYIFHVNNNSQSLSTFIEKTIYIRDSGDWGANQIFPSEEIGDVYMKAFTSLEYVATNSDCYILPNETEKESFCRGAKDAIDVVWKSMNEEMEEMSDMWEYVEARDTLRSFMAEIENIDDFYNSDFYIGESEINYYVRGFEYAVTEIFNNPSL